jgi:hypothetical protein
MISTRAGAEDAASRVAVSLGGLRSRVDCAAGSSVIIVTSVGGEVKVEISKSKLHFSCLRTKGRASHPRRSPVLA